jgi:uncharacterized membrane protein YhaH (DUF805 family)
MNWYVAVLKKYTEFHGRAGREEFWMFFLVNLVVLVGLWMLDGLIGLGLLSALYGLAVLLPTLGVYIRRLHDTGRSGWWVLLIFVPLIGYLILLVLMALPGDAGPNEYGPPPATLPAATV